MTIKRLLASTLIQCHFDYVQHILHCLSVLKKNFMDKIQVMPTTLFVIYRDRIAHDMTLGGTRL